MDPKNIHQNDTCCKEIELLRVNYVCITLSLIVNIVKGGGGRGDYMIVKQEREMSL